MDKVCGSASVVTAARVARVVRVVRVFADLGRDLEEDIHDTEHRPK